MTMREVPDWFCCWLYLVEILNVFRVHPHIHEFVSSISSINKVISVSHTAKQIEGPRSPILS